MLMWEDMKKLEVAILAKYPDRIAIYQQLRDPKLEPSLSPTLVGKRCTHYPFKIWWMQHWKLAVTAASIAYWFSTRRCGLKRKKISLMIPHKSTLTNNQRNVLQGQQWSQRGKMSMRLIVEISRPRKILKLLLWVILNGIVSCKAFQSLISVFHMNLATWWKRKILYLSCCFQKWLKNWWKLQVQRFLYFNTLKLKVKFLPTKGEWWSYERLICYYFANSSIQELFYWVLVWSPIEVKVMSF